MKYLLDSRVLGGILLIIGTSIGGALLILPVSNAESGFFYAVLAMSAVWALTAFAGLLMLEVLLWLPEGSNMISMAKATLGWPGKITAWLLYLVLLYSLLCGYISGGANVLAGFLQLFHISLPPWLNTALFTAAFATVVYRGIHAIDKVNRLLMGCKLGAYALLIWLFFPNVNVDLLPSGHLAAIPHSLMLIIVSFGFAVIIPSLRGYLEGNVAKLRFIILFGTLLPLLLYILWNFVIMGVVPSKGSHGLIALYQKGYSPLDLVTALNQYLHRPLIITLAQFFISICVLTAFLGVALCLNDFLADGLGLKKEGNQGKLLLAITFAPPLLIVFAQPKIFVLALRYAGIICVLLLILLPLMMAYFGRYRLALSGPYQVKGGKPALLTGIAAALVLLAIEILLH